MQRPQDRHRDRRRRRRHQQPPAAQDLVQNRSVFAVVNNSVVRVPLLPVPPGAGRADDRRRLRRHLLRRARQRGHHLGARQRASRPTASPTTTLPKLMKQMGATKVAALAYGVSASSTAAAENLAEVRGARSSGSRPSTPTPRSSSAPPTSGRWCSASRTPAPTRCTCRWSPSSNFAVVQALAQNGVKMKATILATGYGQDLLDQPIVDHARPRGASCTDLRTGRAEDQGHQAVPGRPQEVRRLHRRARLRPVHRVHHRDLLIEGLEAAGPDLTRQGYIDATNAGSAPTTRRDSRASRSTSASRPTGRRSRRAARGTCRSRTASSCPARS